MNKLKQLLMQPKMLKKIQIILKNTLAVAIVVEVICIGIVIIEFIVA